MKKIFKYLLAILTPGEKKKALGLTLADAAMSLLDIGFLLALLFIIKSYSQPAAYTRQQLPLNIGGSLPPVLLLSVFFLLFLLKNALGIYLSGQQYHLVYRVAARISKQTIMQWLAGSYHNFVNIDSSVTQRRVNQQPIEFAHYVLYGVQQLVSQVILVALTLFIITLVNPLLFPLLLLVLGPPVALTAWYMKRSLKNAGLRVRQTSEKSIQHMQESLNGYIESNTNDRNDYFVDRYHRWQLRLNRLLADRLVIKSMPARFIEIVAVLGLLALVVVQATAGRASLSLVTLGSLMIAAYKIIPGIVKISNFITEIKTYSFTAEDIVGANLPAAGRHSSPPPIKKLSFRGLCFEQSGKKILKELSASINSSDFVLLSGPSGSGKTSLLNILLGFLEAQEGTVLINGQPTSAAGRQAYWPRISYVKQQPFILHGSVRENICLCPDETACNEERLAEAVQLAGLRPWLDCLPRRMEELLMEQGKNISGGQRQRIAFARALYRDFDLLLLDEPFSELDENAERELLINLKHLAAKGRMVVLVTHNEAGTAFAGKIMLMDPALEHRAGKNSTNKAAI